MDCENFEDDRGLRPPCSRISAGWYPAYQSDLVVVSSSVAFIYDHLRDAVIAMSLSAPACNCSVFSTTTLEWRKSWTRSIGCWMEESRFLRLGLPKRSIESASARPIGPSMNRNLSFLLRAKFRRLQVLQKPPVIQDSNSGLVVPFV